MMRDADTYGLTEQQIHDFLYKESEKKPEMSLEDYKEAIKKYLVLCPWRYTLKGAEETISWNLDYIEKAYSDGWTVGDIALDIGYTCG